MFVLAPGDLHSVARKLCNFRAEATLIAAAQDRARQAGTTLTSVLERTLRAYADGRWSPPSPRAPRRRWRPG
jgi:hypothetical protein